MARRYIDGDEVRITKTGPTQVKVEFYNGETLEELEPKRLFPLSGLTKYISLLDSEGHEKAIIRNMENLIPESRREVEACMLEYYCIPVILGIIDRKEKFGILKWTVETDRGIKTFNIRNRHSDIKALYDGRILIRDSDDNRYEIKDSEQMDKRSKAFLFLDL